MGDPSGLRYIPPAFVNMPINWKNIPEKSKQFLRDMWLRHWTDKEDQEPPALPATIGELAKAFNGGKFFGYMTPELCHFLLDISEFGLKPRKRDAHDNYGCMLPGPRFYMDAYSKVWMTLFIPGKREGVIAEGDQMHFSDSDYNCSDDEDDTPGVDGQGNGSKVEVEGELEVKPTVSGSGSNLSAVADPAKSNGKAKASDLDADSEAKVGNGDDDEEDDSELEDELYDYEAERLRKLEREGRTRAAKKQREVAVKFDGKLEDEVRRLGLVGIVVGKHLGGWTAYTLSSTLEFAQLGVAMLTLPHGHPVAGAFFKSMFSNTFT